MSANQMSTTSTAQPTRKQLTCRRLALPALLFLTALQPLYFVAGHFLLAAAPLAALLGLEAVATWGERLNDPATVAAWRQRLAQSADEA
jgi:hypothetical protein